VFGSLRRGKETVGDRIKVREDAQEVVKALAHSDTEFANFQGTDGGKIWINPGQVRAVREARK
jgi:hypothetical protein